MTPDRLIRYRPWLYHLTSRENLDSIREEARLYSAARLLDAAGLSARVSLKRPDHLAVEAFGRRRMLRDQKPLYEGNIAFEGGVTFGDVVETLNRFVFFWPGTERGPSEYGVRHFERYRSERPIVLRVSTAALLQTAPSERIHLCAFNSGAPRWTNGRASPRGPSTFEPLETFPNSVSRLVEVVVEHEVNLPREVSVGDEPGGPFRPL